MDTCKGKQPMQLVHLHPDLEKQRSLQRKLTEWWSQLNAKASTKRLGSLQSPPHWDSYDELPKSEVTSPKIFGGVGRNGMIPLLNNAAYSKAEPRKNQFCFEQLLGTSFLLLTQDAVFSWQLVGKITGVSSHQSQHSLLLLWPQLLVNPYSSPLKNRVSR